MLEPLAGARNRGGNPLNLFSIILDPGLNQKVHLTLFFYPISFDIFIFVQVDAGIVQDVLQRIQVVHTILYSVVLLYTKEEGEGSVRKRWTLSILYNINNNSRIIRVIRCVLITRMTTSISSEALLPFVA